MANSNLVQLIKRIAVEAIEAAKPCDYRVGIVSNATPLVIKVSSSITIDEDFLVLTQTASQIQLEKGDKVFILRKSGGNEYIVIDKVVS